VLFGGRSSRSSTTTHTVRSSEPSIRRCSGSRTRCLERGMGGRRQSPRAPHRGYPDGRSIRRPGPACSSSSETALWRKRTSTFPTTRCVSNRATSVACIASSARRPDG
jgi:hypothetical protein